MNRDFKGIWIPKELWFDENLTALEKMIFVELDSLDGENHCIASNNYLANFCGCGVTKVSNAIQKLHKLGYIKIEYTKTHRVISTCNPYKKCKPPLQKVYTSNNSIINNTIINNRDNILLSKDNSNYKRKRNIKEKEILWFITEYKNNCPRLSGVHSHVSEVRKKKIQSVMKKFSRDELLKMFIMANRSDFLAGEITDWKAGFDFVANENNIVKILEGKYENRKSATSVRTTNMTKEQKEKRRKSHEAGKLKVY